MRNHLPLNLNRIINQARNQARQSEIHMLHYLQKPELRKIQTERNFEDRFEGSSEQNEQSNNEVLD
jgi:hypothetical protein